MYDAHGLPYFISSSGIMQFQKACYTAVSYAPYKLLQIYIITIFATFRVNIFEFFHPGPSLYVIIASLKSETKGKLIDRIPGSHLLISSLPGSALRTHVE